MAYYRRYRPTSGSAWDPFSDFRNEVDALFNRFSETAPLSRSGMFPTTNLYETNENYILCAEIPGMESEDIHVSIEGKTVRIQGERKIDAPTQHDVSVHRLERRTGNFRRAFDLPATIDPDKVEAIHKNGILMLRLPKSSECQPRQITVQAS